MIWYFQMLKQHLKVIDKVIEYIFWCKREVIGTGSVVLNLLFFWRGKSGLWSLGKVRSLPFPSFSSACLPAFVLRAVFSWMSYNIGHWEMFFQYCPGVFCREDSWRSFSLIEYCQTWRSHFCEIQARSTYDNISNKRVHTYSSSLFSLSELYD